MLSSADELNDLDFGAGTVLHVDPVSGASSVFMTVPAGPMAGLNDVTFDKAGDVFVSDSFRGVIELVRMKALVWDDESLG